MIIFHHMLSIFRREPKRAPIFPKSETPKTPEITLPPGDMRMSVADAAQLESKGVLTKIITVRGSTLPVVGQELTLHTAQTQQRVRVREIEAKHILSGAAEHDDNELEARHFAHQMGEDTRVTITFERI